MGQRKYRKGVLFNHHIGENSNCPMCLSRAENIKHMIFMFDRAKIVWDSLGVATNNRAISGRQIRATNDTKNNQRREEGVCP